MRTIGLLWGCVDRWSDFDDWLADGGIHSGFGVPQLWIAETEVP